MKIRFCKSFQEGLKREGIFCIIVALSCCRRDYKKSFILAGNGHKSRMDKYIADIILRAGILAKGQFLSGFIFKNIP